MKNEDEDATLADWVQWVAQRRRVPAAKILAPQISLWADSPDVTLARWDLVVHLTIAGFGPKDIAALLNTNVEEVVGFQMIRSYTLKERWQ